MAFDAGAVVGEIILRYDKAVKALTAVEQQTKRSMDRMDRVVQRHQQSIRGLGVAMVAVGAAGLLMGRKLLQAAGQMERYDAQFRVLTGSAEAAQTRLAELIDFAAKTPFDLPGIVEADLVVQAMNLSLGTISKTMQVFGDTAAAMGQPLTRVIATFAKLKAGMFETEQVAVNLGLMKEDFEELGVAFTKTGSVINRRDLFPAAIQLVERFGGTMDEVSKTIEGRLSNLGDAFFQLKVAFGTTILPMAKQWIQQMTVVIERLQAWGEENPQLAASLTKVGLALAGLALILGPMLILLPSLASGIALAVPAIVGLGHAFAAVAAILSGPLGLIALGIALIAVIVKMDGAWRSQKVAAQEVAVAERALTDELITLAERSEALLQIQDRTVEQEEELRDALVRLKAEYPELLRFYQDEKFAASGLIVVLEDLRRKREQLLRVEELQARARQQFAEENLPVLLAEKRALEGNIALLESHKEALIDVGEAAGTQYDETVADLERVVARLAEINDLLGQAAEEPTLAETIAGDGGAAAKTRLELSQIQQRLLQAEYDLAQGIDAKLATAQRYYAWVLAAIERYRDSSVLAEREFAAMLQTGLDGIAENAQSWEEFADLIPRTMEKAVTDTLTAWEFLKQGIIDKQREAAAAWDAMKERMQQKREEERASWDILKAQVDEYDEIWRHTMERIQDGFANTIERVLESGGALRDWWQGLNDMMRSVWANLLASLVAMWFKNFLNKILAGAIGGSLFPGFQHGGIVTQPTLAMVGEAGVSEKITPLTGPMAPASAAAEGPPIIINVSAITPGDGLDFLIQNRDGLATALQGAIRDNHPMRRRR